MTEKLTEKDFLMYFHTSIRNLGLYISVALAILTVSRAYRGKNKLYNLSFIVITILFLIVSAFKNIYLIKTLRAMKNEIKENKLYTDQIMIVPTLILMINITISVFCLYTLYREFPPISTFL